MLTDRFVFRKIKKPNKKNFFIIPYVFTYLNAIFGLLSIINALDNNYFLASIFILLAALMDSFDGRLARFLGSTSYFGMELDSLCDAISFCLAPAVLVYSWHEGLLFSKSNLGLMVLALYLCAGLFRLARFNSSSDDGCDKNFTGLPTTAAAFFISILVLSNVNVKDFNLFLFIVIMSGLMVSKISLPSFKK